MHYYQFNISDYRSDTAHLSIIEHGIYRQLIDWYYLDEKPIPKETQVVMRRLSLGSDSLHFLQNVMSDFFILTENGYYHGRIEEEIEHYKTQSAKNRVNGKLGGRPKKTQVVSERLAKQNPSETQTKGNQELITNNQQPLKEKPCATFVLPDWIDKSQWDLWLKTRKGKKMIPEQMQAQVNKLDKWRGAGLDHAKALADAALNGWMGLQEPARNQVLPFKQSRHTGFEQIDYREGVNADGSF